MARYGFLIDQDSCIGCHACTVACKSENDVPLGVNRTWLKYVEKGEYPNTRRLFSVMRCNHCDNAPCIAICPTGALFRRDDGIVDFDTTSCIGCKSCMNACPYDAIYIDPEEHTAQKCNFCSHRIELGLEPACVVVCPTQAIVAGDLDDPESRLARMIARSDVHVRAPEQGTRPKLFYRGADEASLVPTRTAIAPDGMIWAETTAAHPTVPVVNGHSGHGHGADVIARTAYTTAHPAPWKGKVSAYLVTKALGAGALMVAALLVLLGEAGRQGAVGVLPPVLAGAFIAVTGALLVADLKQPRRFHYILTRPNYAPGLEMILLVGGGMLMIVLVPWVGAKWTLAVFASIVGGAVFGAWHMFSTYQMLLDPVYGSGSVMLLYMMLTYIGYAREEKQRRQVRSAFGYYLSPAMVEQLAEDPSRLKLGGEKRNMSMLFCDVRGFTTISEMFDAEGLTKLINKLLTPLTGVILERKGTVDKYMGDCIMAFWNAPLDDAEHARHACLSALEMNATMGPLNDRLAAEAEAEGRKMIALKVGIGLNSGDVVVGNMGSDQRFDYSILGDEVNLASRLEGQCKTYHVDIVLGQNTQAQVPMLATLELDLIKVKGKTEAVRIFTLLGNEAVAASPEFKDLKTAHDALLAAYRAQDWATARARLADCRSRMDGYNMAGYYDMMDERIAEFEEHSPGADWDGVYVAKTK